MKAPNLSRRRFVSTCAVTLSVLCLPPAALAEAPACALTPQQEDGPFHLEMPMVRGNIA